MRLIIALVSDLNRAHAVLVRLAKGDDTWHPFKAWKKDEKASFRQISHQAPWKTGTC